MRDRFMHPDALSGTTRRFGPYDEKYCQLLFLHVIPIPRLIMVQNE